MPLLIWVWMLNLLNKKFDNSENFWYNYIERNKRWYEKTHGTSPKAPKLSEEERKERNRQRAREYYLRNKEKCQEAKRRWYRENREYALEYQRAYGQSVRTGVNDFEKRRK